MSERLRSFRRDLRREATPAERRLWQMVRRCQLGGRKFRRQHPVGRYIVDFYCPAEKLVVELDGSVHDDPARAEADSRRQRALEAHGLRVVRFANRDVLETPDIVCAAIAAHFSHRA
jgi:very-short-patch-repair endonuclease